MNDLGGFFHLSGGLPDVGAHVYRRSQTLGVCDQAHGDRHVEVSEFSCPDRVHHLAAGA